MNKITKYLNQLIVGNVFDTPEMLEAYSTDRSALKIRPKFVAFPESTEDIRKLMRFFNQIALKNIPVTINIRGSGLDEGGADLGNGLIISTEKINKMLEIDPRERLVRVQAGITLKELNTALSVSGLGIPIGGHDNDTIGGLISNCPTDLFAGKYGGIQKYVERIEVVLANGDVLQTAHYRKYAAAKKTAEKTVEGEIYKKITKLIKRNENLISEISKNRHERSGYPRIKKVYKGESIDLAPLFFGAQGTLGVISEVILKAVPISRRPARAVATFKTLEQACEFMDKVKPLRPRELSIYDLRIIQDARESGKNLDGVIRKLEDGFVVFMSFDERKNYCLKKLAAMQNSKPRSSRIILESPNTLQELGEFQNALYNYLTNTKNSERVPILTDFYLPKENLQSFVNDLNILREKLGLDLALYGDYGSSNYNLRPKFDLSEEGYNKKLATFLRAGAYVIERQGGKLAGGTPEGRLKAIVTNTEMTEPEKTLYTEIKQIFDQNNILSPDIKLGAISKFTLTHLRDTNSPRIML